MKCFVSSVCVFSVLLVVANAAPASVSGSASLQVGDSGSSGGSAGGGGNGLTNILSTIDLPGLLRGVNSFVKLVGAFCPPLSQVLDNVIQNVTSTAFRVFGRAILRNGGLGGGNSGGGGQKVNVVLPTFPPDEDDEDYEDEDTVAPDTAARSGGLEETTKGSATEERATENVSPANEESNLIAKRHVRVIREAEAEVEGDQEGAESAPQPGQDLSNVDVDDQDRNKRYLPFGGSVDAHASGGGSGNFLFDIIRLVAGSGATEETDEKENAPGGVAELDLQGKTADGYTEGIPGPITRLFVIANRGIANLVQDLILRLAQTSERLVNFKARLITSLI